MGYQRITNIEPQLRPVRQSVVAEELPVGATVVAPAALDARVTHCMVSVKTKAVLMTLDGSDPVTATNVGISLPTTMEPKVWSRRMLECAQFVEAVAGQAGLVRIEPLSD